MPILEKLKRDIAASNAVAAVKQDGFTASFFNFFQGRATFFGILFAAIGCVFAGVGVWGFLHGKDLTSLASFVMAMATLFGAIQAVTFAHSAKEDWHVQRMAAIARQDTPAESQDAPPATK